MSDMMSTGEALQIFTSGDFGEIRGGEDENGPWVVAKDIAMALEYSASSISNMADLISHVPDEWKGRVLIPTPGGNQTMLVLYEQGVYFFLARSDKPKALPFQMWLARDVVPAIRKKGTYSVTSPALPVSQKVTKDDVEMLDYFYTFVCEAKGNQRIRAIDRVIKSLSGYSPLERGQYALPDTPDDDLANYKTVTEIGKLFGVSAIKLNPILTGLGLQTAQQKWKKVAKEDGTTEEKPDGFEYKPTPLGEEHGGKRVSDSASNNVQKEVWSLKWHKDKLPAYLREVYFKTED